MADPDKKIKALTAQIAELTRMTIERGNYICDLNKNIKRLGNELAEMTKAFELCQTDLAFLAGMNGKLIDEKNCKEKK